MSDKNPLYCALAFNSISFGAHGGSRPCCAVDTYFWHESKNLLTNHNNNIITWFNNEDIVKLRSDLLEGEWNPICNLCKIREDAGQPSTRQIFNKTLEKVEEKTQRSWREHTATINNLDNIFLLDVTVGNKCNSSCVMCNASASSFWLQEQEAIAGKKLYYVKPMWFSETHVPNLVNSLPNLTALQFVGGEPTVNDDHLVMLRRLIEQGRSGNITLGYVTNLTNISTELLDLWTHFGNKYITVSIDGIEKVNEYIRYPFTWKKVLSQLDKLKSIAEERGGYYIGLSHTVTTLNILTLDEMIRWWEAQVESSKVIQPWLPHIQCVNNPAHLDPVYMPDSMKEETKKMLLRLEEFIIQKSLGDKYLSVINNIRANIIEKKIDSDKQIVMWAKMKKYLSDLDTYRNRNIFDFIPYMKNYWE